MYSSILLQKLIAIERSIGAVSTVALRISLQEAQDYVLEMQRERVEGFWKEPERDSKPRFDYLRQAS